MNSDMVKPERFGHLHLVYHFTVPLRHAHFVFYTFGVASSEKSGENLPSRIKTQLIH